MVSFVFWVGQDIFPLDLDRLVFRVFEYFCFCLPMEH